MQIFCRELTGRRTITTLEVKASDTIKNVKAQITNKAGIPFHLFYLLFMGKMLDERRTVADYNIQENDTIELNLRIRGGHRHLQIGRMLDIDLISEPPPRPLPPDV